MSEDLYLPTALAALVLVLAVALVVSVLALRRTREHAVEALASSRAEQSDLRERVEVLARKVESGAGPRRTPDEFVITDIGRGSDESAQPVAERIEGRLFADIVLRESLVRAASFGHGLRRGLSPETRNRIRFEMKREVKRSRKQRRVELKAIRRERAARQRAEEDVARDGPSGSPQEPGSACTP
ncbi:MAG: hypothetical protein L0H93_19145 [Nocardioides sp.]|nr:hypothetical protein [Nocardioides sp.]